MAFNAAGLILLKPNSSTSLELASTAAFLTKLYSDYLDSIKVEGGACGDDLYSLDDLQNFAASQASTFLIYVSTFVQLVARQTYTYISSI